MKVSTHFTFIDGATAATTGKTMFNPDGDSLTVSISGTFEGTLKMQGYLNGEWYDLHIIDLDDLNVVKSVAGATAGIVVGVEGFERIRANLTSITSGTATVVGRLTRGN